MVPICYALTTMKHPSPESTVAWTVAFVVFSAVAGTGVTFWPDFGLIRIFQRAASAPLDVFGNVLSVAGGWELTSVLLLALTAVMYWRGHREIAMRVFGLFLATALLEFLLKMYLPVTPIPQSLGRGGEFAPTLEIIYPYPYPSGHMLRSTILLGALYLWSGSRNVGILAAALLGMMAATRVYLGVHWPSDVVGGFLLGGVALCLAFTRRKKV